MERRKYEVTCNHGYSENEFYDVIQCYMPFKLDYSRFKTQKLKIIVILLYPKINFQVNTSACPHNSSTLKFSFLFLLSLLIQTFYTLSLYYLFKFIPFIFKYSINLFTSTSILKNNDKSLFQRDFLGDTNIKKSK